ncbi:MAG: exonuclease RecJ, partial [Haloferacaceae archaeon]
GGPFATLGGYADVLDAVAREAPGVGVALALGGRGDVDPREAALEAWRRHATAVHGHLRAATTARYDGAYVARVETATLGRLVTAAGLLRDFRSPEPVALAVADGGAAAAATAPDGLRERVATAAAAAGADASPAVGGPAVAGVQFDDAATDDGSGADEFVAAFRGAA